MPVRKAATKPRRQVPRKPPELAKGAAAFIVAIERLLD
jgi:hypothetical protein